MERIDKVIFGDNQFFGINHMSQEKAQQLSERFLNINNIFEVYEMAFKVGIDAVMLNSNDRAKEICEYFKRKPDKYGHMKWYPSIPYPHKYANLVAEKGIVSAISEILFKDNTAKDILGMITKGSKAVFSRDVIKLMQILVDLEMKMFKGLNVKAVFLQSILTDLLLGYDVKEIFEAYCLYIRKKYKAHPGLITQNMPMLKTKLEEWNINEVVICSSFNKIGYLMSPDIKSYVESTRDNDPDRYQLMAMSTLASGAIPPAEAYEFINAQKIQSVVFGASTHKHITDTANLINIK